MNNSRPGIIAFCVRCASTPEPVNGLPIHLTLDGRSDSGIDARKRFKRGISGGG